MQISKIAQPYKNVSSFMSEEKIVTINYNMKKNLTCLARQKDKWTYVGNILYNTTREKDHLS